MFRSKQFVGRVRSRVRLWSNVHIQLRETRRERRREVGTLTRFQTDGASGSGRVFGLRSKVIGQIPVVDGEEHITQRAIVRVIVGDSNGCRRGPEREDDARHAEAEVVAEVNRRAAVGEATAPPFAGWRRIIVRGRRCRRGRRWRRIGGGIGRRGLWRGRCRFGCDFLWSRGRRRCGRAGGAAATCECDHQEERPGVFHSGLFQFCRC